MLELRHVSKAYHTPSGPNVVLSDLSLTFPHGANIGILGRNGAGKSTLLRILAGIELPDEGEVIRRSRVSWPLGFAGGFNSSLSGEENCRFVARIYGAEVDEVVDYARDFADLGTYFQMPVRTYSAGMRARLAFGLSMAIDFSIYLVDEVTAVGDKRFQKKCREAFAARRERSSVILVSHNMGTVREYCDRCMVLDDGCLLMFDDVEQATRAYEVT